MKKTILYLLICLFFIAVTTLPLYGSNSHTSFNITERPPIEWEKTYGGKIVDWGRSVQQTSDGGYIVSGAYQRNAYTPCQGFVYVLKIDVFGNVEWDQQYGIVPNENVGQCIQQTSDGGYIIAGFTGYNYHFDAYILKIDSTGTLQWTRILGLFDFYDDSLSVQETTDGGFILTGWTGSNGAGSSDVWLIKLNATGEDEWIHTYGGSGLDGADSVQQTSDGGYIIAGTTHSFDAGGNGDIWMIKTDTNGNELWNTSIGGGYLDRGRHVQQTLDGGYIITGSTMSYGEGDCDVWLVKTDSVGNELWNCTFGGSQWDEGKSVRQTADHGYFLTGDYTDPARGDLEVYMIKTDEYGLEEWSYIIDHNGVTDSGSYGIQTQDGGYLITGETGKYNLAAVDVLLIKLQGANAAPNAPVLNGPTSGDYRIEYSWNITAIDPDSDDIFYYIDWGDGTNTSWSMAYTSGETIVRSHKYPAKGTYTITGKAKDIYGAESDWGFLSVTMPCSSTIPFYDFLIKVFKRFPNALPILRYLFGL
ncbi:MAG: PKD domain-containing protein [Candidatus Thermoplasmatota archaeon]|nr:PKD domain-containing protein [Candidatus Thermoplasmatota archaeon]